jgi:dihydrolipoamide dehydrogenase
MSTFDLVVIGGGPAGYVPAIRAAQLGRKVAVVEEDLLGGTCLNRGCIPTKTLVASAALYRHAASSKRFGLEGSLTMDWSSLARRKDTVVTRLRKGIEAHFGEMGIELVRGHGVLRSADTVFVEGRELTADRILLSPGSLPLLPGPFAAEGVQTSRDVLSWEELPGSLLIVGGGVIGCEFASVFATFGVDVTIVEMLPEILPGIDSDVTGVVHRSLVKSGVKIFTGSGAKSVSVSGGSASVALSDGTVHEAEALLVAIGRRCRVDDLGLSEAGVDHSQKGIACDRFMRTNLPGVYTAGDATGLWQLAHAGSAQALAAVDHMFGDGSRNVDPDAMPGCIFTFPEIATVGPGEEEWRSRGVEVRTGYARYIANGKAVGMNETEGFVKIISRAADDTVIGVQIVGADASSLVGEAVVAVGAGVTARRLGAMIHPHPTLSELFMEAGEALGDGAIHG